MGAAHIALVHAGYKGSTPALTDVMGGRAPLMFDGMPTSLRMITSGKVKALAVNLRARSPLLPQVPTFTELGYPQLEAVSWMGLWVTPEVPAAVQARRLREAALADIAPPQTRERLREVGSEPGQPRSSDEMQRALRADHERVGAMLMAIGFKPE